MYISYRRAVSNMLFVNTLEHKTLVLFKVKYYKIKYSRLKGK